MIGLFVILLGLAAVPLAALALSGTLAARDIQSPGEVRAFGWALTFQAFLLLDCVTLGYLAARW